jgi:DnaJ family protein B protein 12
MVADANRDEALTCLQKAKEAMLVKDEAKMKRFIEKARRLDPSCDVKSFLTNGAYTSKPENTEKADKAQQERSYSHDDHYEEPEMRNRRRSRPSPSRASNASAENPSSSQKSRSRSRSTSATRRKQPDAPESFNADEVQAVERIRHCKDYYEILQVEKNCTEIILKKKYRELALKLHPDKCKVPGATDAFKALGNAYAVLSDSKKRAEYDRYGAEGAHVSRRRNDFYDYDVGRGFEAEMSPEGLYCFIKNFILLKLYLKIYLKCSLVVDFQLVQFIAVERIFNIVVKNRKNLNQFL